MQTSRLLSSSSNSPSFGSFSTAVDLAAIAARVVEEFRDHEPPQSDDSHRHDDDDFEFAFDCSSSQPIATADEIFCNGQIRPMNPYGGESQSPPSPSSPSKTTLRRNHRRPALRKLMSEDRDPTSKSSSSSDSAAEEEDLAGVPPESYCVWKPKQSNFQSHSKIKSNSTGFSKRWKLRNLLYTRSNSEGNEKLVFPAPIKKIDENETVSDQKEEERESEETKRQTFVPFRKDVIGILKNVNGLNRHLRPL